MAECPHCRAFFTIDEDGTPTYYIDGEPFCGTCCSYACNMREILIDEEIEEHDKGPNDAE